MKRQIACFLLVILMLNTLSTVYAWTLERPGADMDINETVQSVNSNGEATVGLGVAISEYDEEDPIYGSDSIMLNISMAANSREGIAYERSDVPLVWIPEDQLVYKTTNTGVGDEAVIAIDIPQNLGLGFRSRFYGGPDSAEYQKVYVSTNGFISFNNTTSHPIPMDIPSQAEPNNGTIAALWTDLVVDNNAQIVTGLYQLLPYYFVIIWKNVLHAATGRRLTFQIVIQNAEGCLPYRQSEIWLSYLEVESIYAYNFAIGIENQYGLVALVASIQVII